MRAIFLWGGLLFGVVSVIWGFRTKHAPMMRMGAGSALFAFSRVPSSEALQIGVGAVGLALLLWGSLHFSGILPWEPPSAEAEPKSS